MTVRPARLVGPSLILLLALSSGPWADAPLPDDLSARLTRLHAIAGAQPSSARLGFDSLLVECALEQDECSAALHATAQERWTSAGDSAWLQDLRMALRIPADLRSHWLRALALDAEARERQAQRDFETAASRFTEASDLYLSVGDRRRHALALGSLGVVRYYAGDYDAAKTAYSRALEARWALGDSVLIGNSLNSLGSVHFHLGDLDAAFDYYRRAREIRTLIDDRSPLANTLTYLGHICVRRHQLLEAEAYYRKALDTFPEDAPQQEREKAMGGMASVYKDLGEFEKAIEIYQAQTERQAALNDTLALAVARQNLGAVLIELGDYAAALRELLPALSVQENAGDVGNLPNTLNNLGTVYLQLGDLDEALAYYGRAREVAEGTGDAAGLIHALFNCALTQARREQLQLAQEKLAKARVLVDATQDTVMLITLIAATGEIQAQQGRMAEALESFLEALQLAKQRDVGSQIVRQQVNVANTLTALGRLAEAQSYFREAIRGCETEGRNDILWTAYLGMADNAELSGDLKSAEEYNDRSIQVLEGWWSRALSPAARIELVRRQAVVYEAQIRVLARLHEQTGDATYAERAFEVLERGKARALRDLLAEPDVLVATLSPELASAITSAERALKAVEHGVREASDPRLARELEAERDSLEAQYRRLMEQARAQDVRLASLAPNTEANLPVIRQKLLQDGRTIVLAYSLGDSASYVWAVGQHSIELHPLAPQQEIIDAVLALRTVITRRESVDSFVKEAHGLYEMLLAPVALAVAAADLVYIAPDDALYYLPFEVLLSMDPRADRPSDRQEVPYDELPYAFGATVVRYGPSGAALAGLAVRNAAAAGDGQGRMELLALGDPAFTRSSAATARSVETDASPLTRGNHAALPSTRTEVEAISSLFPEGRKTVLVGAEAQESAVARLESATDYRFIHMATHGLADESYPDRSCLVLAAPDTDVEDGYLQAREIYGMALRADLVVLSACDTGLGRIARGEGVLGLTRAFLFAGARSVVASLWEVADESTSAHMRHFYQAMVTQNKTPGEALQQARAAIRCEPRFSHPYFWGAFVLLGPAGNGN